MTIWDGHLHDGPEDESEQEGWEESNGDVPCIPDGLHDEAAPWRGLEHPVLPVLPTDPGWPQDAAGPIYELMRAEVEEDEERRKREQGGQ